MIYADNAATTRMSKTAIEAMLPYLEENFRMLEAALQGTKIRVLPLEGTYLAWLDCRALGLSKDALYKLFLEQAGVWLQSGADFGKGGDGFLRMNIGCPHTTMKEHKMSTNNTMNNLQYSLKYGTMEMIEPLILATI